MGTSLKTERGRYVVPKLAFEISNRINDVTPITPISLVTLALLSHPSEGLTVDETVVALEPFVETRPLSAINETFEELHAGKLTRRPILIPES